MVASHSQCLNPLLGLGHCSQTEPVTTPAPVLITSLGPSLFGCCEVPEPSATSQGVETDSSACVEPRTLLSFTPSSSFLQVRASNLDP